MKKIHVSAAVILRGKDEILATQRGYGDYRGWWEFPGGKTEPGESSEDALKREIREELDADIEIRKLLCTVEYDYPKFHLEMDCFLCTLKDDGFELKEHLAARWVRPSEYSELKWLGADIEVLEKLKKEFEK